MTDNQSDKEVILGALISLIRQSETIRHRLHMLTAYMEKIRTDHEEILQSAAKVIHTYTTPSFIIKEKKDD